MKRRILVLSLVLLWLIPASTQATGVTSVDDDGPRAVERVATLDFVTTEIVTLLGLEPVAVAGKPDYLEWVGIGADAVANAANLGRRTEPNQESLAAANPQLITGATFRHKPLADSLRRIAPVVLYNWLPASDQQNPLEHTRALVRHLAQRIDRGAQAERLLTGMDEALARQASRVREAGMAGEAVILAQHVRGTNRFNLYSEHSLGVAIIQTLGLTNAWEGEPEKFGYTTVGLARLTRTADAHMLLVAQPDDRAFEQVTNSPVWRSVPAVASGRVHRLAPQTWFFGGPETISQLARQFTDALLSD